MSAKSKQHEVQTFFRHFDGKFTFWSFSLTFFDKWNCLAIMSSKCESIANKSIFWFLVLGCRDPKRPMNSYMVFRNATHAYLLCDLGHLYPDTLTRDRWLYCNPLEDTWTGTISHCQGMPFYQQLFYCSVALFRCTCTDDMWLKYFTRQIDSNKHHVGNILLERTKV